MLKRYINFDSAQGAGSYYEAKRFFINNGPDGVADATVFLDYYTTLSPNSRERYRNLWELLRTSHNLIGMLLHRQDEKGLDYVWLEVELPRGKQQFKVILLSDAMFEFFVKYQRAEVTIRFTLKELVEEAQRIETDGANSTDAK